MDGVDWDGLNKSIQARQFELCCTLPLSWKAVFFNLKRAADQLFDRYHDSTLRSVRMFLEETQAARAAGITLSVSRTLEGQELEDHRDGGLISVYYLLVGYAVENLLKGLLMIQHPEYFKPEVKLVEIRSHNMVALAKRCGITVSPDEERLLVKLSEHVEWRGKYPVPLEIGKAYPKQSHDRTWEHSGEAFHGRAPQEAVDKFCYRLLIEIENQRQDEKPQQVGVGPGDVDGEAARIR